MSPPRPDRPCPRCGLDDWKFWGVERTGIDTTVFVWYCARDWLVHRVEEMSDHARGSINSGG
jgi:hypothetical protein